MDKETREKLIDLVKNSKFAYADSYFNTGDQYKAIDKIYIKYPKETVNIIYELALNLDKVKTRDTEDRIFVLYNLLVTRKYANDIMYLKSVFRKMVLGIFGDEKYVKFRSILPELIYAGFDRKETEGLFRKYLKTEINQHVITNYKFELLSLDLLNAFPKQGGFSFTTSTLELSEPREYTVEHIQILVDARIKKDGAEIVHEWLKMFYNHEYTKEGSKQVLKQIKINNEYVC